MEQSIIYVKSRTGEPLMPTRRHSKVWYWLRKGLARVVCREPLTIQLRFETTGYIQPVTVGVDTGAQAVGLAAVANEEVLLQAEVHLRTDIKQKLDQRRKSRRTRRSRKTRYRPARFANRRRPAGWLPPSLRSSAEATLRAVRWVLQLEHIIPKARGGSERVSNLALACEACNLKKGTQTAVEFGFPQVQAQAKLPLKAAAHVSSMKTAIVGALREQFGHDQVCLAYGYETKYTRIQRLGLPKSHTNDAVAIACRMGEVVKPSPLVFQLRCIPRGNYQLYNGKRSEHKIWAPKKVQGWKLYELVEAKGHVGYIGGRRLKGAFVVKDPLTSKTLVEVTPRKLVRVSRPVHGWMLTRLSFEAKEERASSSA